MSSALKGEARSEWPKLEKCERPSERVLGDGDNDPIPTATTIHWQWEF